MQRSIVKQLATAISAGIFLILGIGAAYAQSSMTLGYSDDTGSIYDVGAKSFKSRFEKYTDGKVSVHLYCCMQMGGEQEEVKKLQLGVLDGAIVAQNNLGPFFPLINVLVLPYIIQSHQHALRVLDGPIGKMMAKRLLKETGLRVIGWPQVVFRQLYNDQRPIHSLADLKGIRWRVPNNKVMIQTFKAFGVTPTPLAFSALMSGLQTGTVQGGSLPIIPIYSNKYWELCKHIAMTDHFVVTAPLLVSNRYYKTLTPQEQKALYRAGREGAAAAQKFSNANNLKIIAKLKAQGVKFTYPDHKPFIAAARKVWEEFATKQGTQYADFNKLIHDIVALAPAK